MNFVLIFPKLEYKGNKYLRLEYKKPKKYPGRKANFYSKILIIHTIKDPTAPKIKIIDRNKILRSKAERNRLKENGEIIEEHKIRNGQFSVQNAKTFHGSVKNKKLGSSLDNNHTIYGCGNIDIDKLTDYEEWDQPFTYEDENHINDCLMNDLPGARYSDGKFHIPTPFKDIYGYYFYKLHKSQKKKNADSEE